MAFNHCRFCKNILGDDSVRFAPRHYAHVRCLVSRFGIGDELTKRLMRVPLWQLRQIPYFEAKDLGILDVLKKVVGHEHEPVLADIHYTIAKFPAVFGLRGFPGKVFKISRAHSYINHGSEHLDSQVILYTEVQDGDRWLSFAKGTEAEIRAQIVEVQP